MPPVPAGSTRGPLHTVATDGAIAATATPRPPTPPVLAFAGPFDGWDGRRPGWHGGDGGVLCAA